MLSAARSGDQLCHFDRPVWSRDESFDSLPYSAWPTSSKLPRPKSRLQRVHVEADGVLYTEDLTTDTSYRRVAGH